jgi:hypothetical protein
MKKALLLVPIGCLFLTASLWLRSHPRLAIPATALQGPVSPFDPAAHPLLLKLTFGLEDKEPSDWNGIAHLDKGHFLDIQGWVFDGTEQVHGPTVSWQVKSKMANFDTSHERGSETGEVGGARRTRYGSSPTRPAGLWLQLKAPADATLAINTVKGDFKIPLAKIPARGPMLVLENRVSLERAATVLPVAQSAAQEDYPSLAVVPGGRLYASWIAYQEGSDQVLFSSWENNGWLAPQKVTEKSGIYGSTAMAADDRGRVWAVYNALDGSQFDLWARQIAPVLGKSVRLTQNHGNNIHPRAHANKQGNLWLVWQALRDGNSDIYAMRAAGLDSKPKEIRVTDNPGDDWDPEVAIDSSGNAIVVWDSYRNGDYDVYMRPVSRDGSLGNEMAVSATPQYEAHASAVFDREDRLWVAWEESGPKWGKDTGQESTNEGTKLHSFRHLGLKCRQDGRWFHLQDGLPAGFQKLPLNFQEQPRLVTDQKGKVWLIFRQWVSRQNPPEVWNECAIFFDGAKWSDPIELPRSDGRLTQELGAAAHPDGSIWVIYATDYRGSGSSRRGLWDVFSARLGSELAALPVSGLTPDSVALPATRYAPTPNKGYQTDVGGKKYRLFYGDLHRHTDIRGHGGTDPSVPDLYRYALDAAELDFMATTDHNLVSGNAWSDGLDEYAWWITQKNADLHFFPGRFVSLYGYERSMAPPGGHRNIIWPNRGGELIPGDRRLAPDNIPLGLWERLKHTDGISIPHTTAEKTQPNVSWDYQDPVSQPVMEMYQGARSSYEYAGAKPEDRRGNSAMDKPGHFLWDALDRGYRIGVIASSDHGSTHQSYAGVYAADFTRDAIVDAMRKRHTFAATDNIILDFRIEDAFMGDEIVLSGPPKLQIKAMGTGPIRQIDIIKDNHFIYSTHPGKKEAQLVYLDQDAQTKPEGDYYYIRVIQEDKMMAWSSAIWVRKK